MILSFVLILSGALMLWDTHNQLVIVSMGMAWDTGAPLWPYEIPNILFRSLNFPAVIIAQPVANYFGFVAPMHYFVVFPATVLWWWFVGWKPRGAPAQAIEHWRPILLSSMLLTVFISWGEARGFIGIFPWPFLSNIGFWGTNAIRFLRLLGPTLWCVALTSTTIIATKRFSKKS